MTGLTGKNDAEYPINNLDISYTRPRFRALCALQACGREEIVNYFNRNEMGIDDATLTLINQYVLKGKIEEYLLKVRNDGDTELARKATKVLRELKRYSK